MIGEISTYRKSWFEGQGNVIYTVWEVKFMDKCKTAVNSGALVSFTYTIKLKETCMCNPHSLRTGVTRPLQQRIDIDIDYITDCIILYNSYPTSSDPSLPHNSTARRLCHQKVALILGQLDSVGTVEVSHQQLCAPRGRVEFEEPVKAIQGGFNSK